uniref:Uncharacterized protein n=1 Tax=Sphaerodactylus townsendi TaxID=933632 RepID=A0ACB8FIR0_9SAUR
MATGSFTSPRESFARLTVEGTRAAKSTAVAQPPTATVQPEMPPSKKKALHKDKMGRGDADDPAPKRARDQTAAGSQTPSEGVAIHGGSSTGSSYPMVDSESPVPPLPHEDKDNSGPVADAVLCHRACITAMHEFKVLLKS